MLYSVMPTNTPQRISQYFRVKARQLDTLADLPICEHSTLIGSHREEIYRIYLSEVLPKRYAVGRGMVYGLVHRSREADIVIWDAQNYPALPMLDHSFFFAESVRAVLESKSSWSAEEFENVKNKCGAVRAIVPMRDPGLTDQIWSMQQDIFSLQTGRQHNGSMLIQPHIGTAAMFFRGGNEFKLPKDKSSELDCVDNDWPDALLLLGVGRVVLKQYVYNDNRVTGRLELYDLGTDALLVFTAALLSLVTARSSALESPLDLRRYAVGFSDHEPFEVVQFPLTRMPPQRIPLWKEGGEPGGECED